MTGPAQAVRAAIFDAATGRISRIVTAPAKQLRASCLQGERFLPVGDNVTDATHRIDPATLDVLERLALGEFSKTEIAANGADDAVLSGLPAGTVAMVVREGETGAPAARDGMLAIDDGVLAIDSTVPARIRVLVIPPFTHMEREYFIDAR